jgi:glycosyltransferase 2 family protein
VSDSSQRYVGLLRRVGLSALGTAAGVGYLVWKVDLGQAWSVLSAARPAPFLGALAIVIAVTWPLAWRWQQLLRAKGVDDRLSWLVRASLVAQTAGQVLPTGIGGDAMRILETSRRHPSNRAAATGSVLLERVLGGCATLVLAGIGFALAAGKYDVNAYLGLEIALAVGALAGMTVLLSRAARAPLKVLVPLLRRVRLERPLRHAYEAVHAYRSRPGLLVGAFVLTIVIQAIRVLAIWLTGRAAGLELSPRPFYVMGPLLFLVSLIPFTVNGLAVRESLFVAFLGSLGVSSNQAFVTGFLYLLLSVGLAVPGAIILAIEAATRMKRNQPDPKGPTWPVSVRTIHK